MLEKEAIEEEEAEEYDVDDEDDMAEEEEEGEDELDEEEMRMLQEQELSDNSDDLEDIGSGNGAAGPLAGKKRPRVKIGYEEQGEEEEELEYEFEDGARGGRGGKKEMLKEKQSGSAFGDAVRKRPRLGGVSSGK